ncbi:Endonuclease/exonuclease/phosphatase [Scheffersomyces coipomensis]|uniref:Endonuclease/exonuclease/phosphatase n=1 Tax=Scheffersomyces coipomensis TaxID=1788519 RepID=UPI00315CC6FB
MDNIPVYLFTYNCNKQSLDWDIFLPKFKESLPEELATVYAFGLEEFCSIQDGSFYSTANQHLIKYNGKFLEALSSKYGTRNIRFQTIGMQHIGSIGLVLITPYPSKFKHITKASTSCGYAYSSLKGGVGIRVVYSPGGKTNNSSVTLSFANAHLSAYEGDDYYTQRNSDATQIMRSLDFGDGYGLLKPGSHTFFMGDLNYRTCKTYVSSSASSQKLLSLQDQSLATTESIDELLHLYDELTTALKTEEVYSGFTEAQIKFQPTYKYHVHTAIYNSKRSPAWCDRILYQSTYEAQDESAPRLKKDDNVTKIPIVKFYKSINSILLSDHQPVHAFITLPFNAPTPILASNGFLKVLPHDPTQIYMLPTKVDYFIQTYIRFLVDNTIGYSLTLTFTNRGRVILLFLICLLWYSVYTFL